MVLLKVSPWKGVIHFKKQGKMCPRYIGLFRFLARVARVAYRLDLLAELSRIHCTFHVSQLWKCLFDDPVVVHLEDIQVDKRLNYIERSIVILDWKEKTLRNKLLGLFKVQWQHQKGSEWTWEPEDEMKEHYLELFRETDFKDEV